MKNKQIWLGMLALALTIGMAVIGCDNGSTSGGNDIIPNELQGTWVSDDAKITAGGAYFIVQSYGESARLPVKSVVKGSVINGYTVYRLIYDENTAGADTALIGLSQDGKTLYDDSSGEYFTKQ